MLFLPNGVPSSIICNDPKSLDMVLKCLVVGGLLASVVGNGVAVVVVLGCFVVVVIVVMGFFVFITIFILFSGVGSCSLLFLLGVTFTTMRGRSPVILGDGTTFRPVGYGGMFWPIHSGTRVSRAPQPIILAPQERQHPLRPSPPPGFRLLLLILVSGPHLPSLPRLPEYPSGLRPYTSEGVSCGCVPSGHHLALTP